MEDDFYATIKLLSGEEIFAKVSASDEDDRDIWDTLHEKKYRDAIDYKAAEKIKAYKEKQRT